MKNEKLFCGVAFNWHDSSISFTSDARIIYFNITILYINGVGN